MDEEGFGKREGFKREYSEDSGGRGGGFRNDFRGPRRDFGGPREMHKATCSECGKECEVPFKPTEGKPVYCKDCYMKRKPRRF